MKEKIKNEILKELDWYDSEVNKAIDLTIQKTAKAILQDFKKVLSQKKDWCQNNIITKEYSSYDFVELLTNLEIELHEELKKKWCEK